MTEDIQGIMFSTVHILNKFLLAFSKGGKINNYDIYYVSVLYSLHIMSETKKFQFYSIWLYVIVMDSRQLAMVSNVVKIYKIFFLIYYH